MSLILEPMKRDGYCRLCDSLLQKEDKVAVKFYSHRNKGQSILLCIPCSVKIGKAANSYIDTGEFIDE